MTALFNRNFVLVLVSNAILGSPMPMLIILGGLAGAMLTPVEALATLPISIQLLAGLVAASPISMLMGRIGRSYGFTVAAMLAFIGGLMATVALLYSSFVVLCIGHAFLGAAVASFNYFRFAGAEVVPAQYHSKAISLTLGSGIVAAVVGPQIYLWTRDALHSVPLAGSYIAICVIAVIGCIPVLMTHYPDVAQSRRRSSISDGIALIKQRPGVLTAMLSAALAYGAMVLLMTATPLAMVQTGHGEGVAGDVIRWHVIAMFAPSFFTGSIIARLGSRWVIVAGALLLAAAGLCSALDTTLINFYASLILLGVGWNFGYVGGSAQLNDALEPSERPVVQGANDTLIALCATGASFASGALLTGFGWPWTCYAVLPLAALMVVFVTQVPETRDEVVSPDTD